MDIHKDYAGEIYDAKKILKEIKSEQHKMQKYCMHIPFGTLRIGGTTDEGDRMLESATRMALENFDKRCDYLISQLNINNHKEIEDKIFDEYEYINDSIKVFNSEIGTEYLALKQEQCEYEYKILLLQTEKKEIEKTEKEIIKEQLKEERALVKDRDKHEKKLIDLQYKLNKTHDENKQVELMNEIGRINMLIEDDEYKLTHGRCGYVYVVSNNDMREGQYKIGITRRTVEERMKELGSGASHSFPMNVHGYAYCSDCFQVESALHHYFDKQRVNQLNPRKEWFKTTLEEIKRAFKEVCGIDIDLVDCADESYLYSQDKVEI